MTATDKNRLLDILDDEWQRIRLLDLNDNPMLIQYAAAVWTMLELFPSRERFVSSED